MTPSAVAIVLTYRRPKLATAVVRGLLATERFPPGKVLLVVNGDGGLDDPGLEREICVLRLPRNLGPAGGFKRGLLEACDRWDDDWVYVCEDDDALLALPRARVQPLIDGVEEFERTNPGAPVGAVLVRGRDLDRRTGMFTLHRVTSDRGFDDVDVGPWTGTIVSRRVIAAGIVPDEDFFFGLEDYEYWLRMRSSGYRVLVDRAAAHATVASLSGDGRAAAFAGRRPVTRDEAWSSYYTERNFFELRRRQGGPRWTLWHLALLARQLRAAPPAQRIAMLDGLKDGVLHRTGINNRYQRRVGEF